MANTQLSRTIGTATNGKKYTLSFWIKRSALGVEQSIVGVDSANLIELIKFGSNDKLYWYNRDNAGNAAENYTSNVFRDTSAWYHLVFSYDSTEGSAANQKKLYINGVAQTWGSTAAIQADAIAGTNFATKTFYFGREGGGTSYFLNGLMSHIHYIDGTVYTASNFGSTDSTTGEWKINTSPSVTYGNNGFFILKNSNSVTDQSGNSNNFTVAGGTLTSTKDCPSNVYATWNVLNRNISTGIQSGGVANGNTYLATLASNGTYSFGSTLALKGTGKFYMEFKVSQTGTYMGVGIAETDALTTMLNAGAVAKFSDNAKGWSYKHTGYKENGGSQATYGATYTANDYIGLAYNNGTIWFSKNGTWQNSATISEINAGTTTNSAFTGLDTSKDYFIMFDGYNDSMIEMNAGNGWFRTTEISSPNNPTSGDTGAKFKYTVPTGYQPLSTKGLNQ